MVSSTETGLNVSAVVGREYCLRKNGKWSEVNSVPSTSLGSIHAKLLELKEQIGAVCAGNDDGIRRWRLHTQATHPLSAAPKLLREKFNCSATSQAYCKFLEILVRFPRLLHIHSSCKCLRSFHLCEAPGHFISVLDRFLCTFYSKMDWFWEANSLNPHYEGTSACEMLLEDEIILGQPEKWHFGKDGSGDITKWDNGYISSLVDNGCFHLVTADGSLYTQDAPSEQESKTLPLLESEFRVAFELLANGGSLIIKVYTLYMPDTRQLISSFISHFSDVYVFKPMSSKGGNNERYLVCMGFNRCDANEDDGRIGDNVLLNCEAYFSTLQSSFIKTNLETYNTISKTEIGIYRDCVFREFHKRALTNYIAKPLRTSHLNQDQIERPWIEMFGKNYVETLRQISDKRSAVEFLKNFHQVDVMAEHDGVGRVEVEFAENELEFLEWPTQALLNEKILVASPAATHIVHSLFAPPGLLQSLRVWKPEALVDLCFNSRQTDDNVSHYLISLNFCGALTIDACKLRSQKDWFSLLSSVLSGVQKEEISQLELVWSAPSTPFVLSRFSASVIALLCVMFFQFCCEGGQRMITFSKPNYPEDIPQCLESYLCMLPRISSEMGSLHCFVPTPMLAMLHPYLLDLNRRQWQCLLSRENLAAIDVNDL